MFDLKIDLQTFYHHLEMIDKLEDVIVSKLIDILDELISDRDISYSITFHSNKFEIELRNNKTLQYDVFYVDKPEFDINELKQTIDELWNEYENNDLD